MVSKDNDKVECAACESVKPGTEPHQGQKKNVKPLFSFVLHYLGEPSHLTAGGRVKVGETNFHLW